MIDCGHVYGETDLLAILDSRWSLPSTRSGAGMTVVGQDREVSGATVSKMETVRRVVAGGRRQGQLDLGG